MTERPLLVLLHGWGSTAAVWQPVLEQLQDRFECYLPELPGHGGSTFTATQLESLAQQILESVHRPAIWLGWSLGALIAMQAAGLTPGEVLTAATRDAARALGRGDDGHDNLWNAAGARIMAQFEIRSLFLGQLVFIIEEAFGIEQRFEPFDHARLGPGRESDCRSLFGLMDQHQDRLAVHDHDATGFFDAPVGWIAELFP